MNKISTRILVVALVAAVLSTALAVNQTIGASAVQKSQSTQLVENEKSQTASEHSSRHVPSFVASKDLNQTKVTEFRIALRDLWVDHIVWTRQFIVDSASDLPSLNDTTNRLLKNQEDIGNAIKPFYGGEAGDKLTSLLKDHILIAVDLLNAAKAGNNTGLEEAEKKWHDNADDIATFLSNANPNWPEDHLVKMLDQHLSLTKSEAVARLTGNYTADIDAFDEIHRQAMTMADELADGIVKQFPEKFEVDRTIARSN